MDSDIGEKIKSLREKLGRTQKEFANLVRVEPPVISSWETGAKTPSEESYLKMARLADYPESLWFLEQAGVTSEDMYRAVSRMVDADIMAVASSEIVPIRPLGKLEPLISLPQQFIKNPLSTRYLKSDAASGGLV